MSLDDFTKNANSDLINELIGKMKTIEPSNFKEGVATVIRGTIPKFKFNYSLNFLEDLQKLGIKDVFDSELADLTNISNVQKGDPDYYNIFIQDAKHVADIDFSQKGIKAAAVTLFGGGGGGGEPEEFEFYYSFEVPTEEIDLDFNKPYAFLIRDKDTNETWFVGTVYQPRLFSDEETDFGGGV
jgi:serine protease inhibitor